MDKTILVMFHMFTKKQQIIVMTKEGELERAEASVDEIADTVNALANKYSIQTVNIKGSKIFNKKIGTDIQQKGISQYNNQFIINYIK